MPPTSPAPHPDGDEVGPPFTEASLGYLVNRLAREFTAAVQHRLAPFNVLPGQLPALLQLYEREDRTQTELARAAGVEQPTMANTLRRMERDGFIERVPDPYDGRRALVRLSPRARRLETAIRTELEAVNTLAAEGLTGAEIRSFIQTLIDITTSLATSRDEP